MSRIRIPAQRAVLLAALAGAVLAAGALAAARSARTPGTYRGLTAQGIAVQLGPQRAFGRTFRYRARMTCSEGSTFLDDYFSDDVRVRRGRFSSRVQTSGGAVRTTVTGTLHGTRATGTIRIIERYSEIPDSRGDTPLAANGAIVCDSHVVRWNARARPGT